MKNQVRHEYQNVLSFLVFSKENSFAMFLALSNCTLQCWTPSIIYLYRLSELSLSDDTTFLFCITPYVAF